MEYTLWNKREVMIYQIPPASSSSGHKADDWKDCIWRGSCRIVGKGKDVYIKMIDPSTGNLFAQCTIPDGEHDKYVDRVKDSSRYFVLKITNGARHAFIGLGFEDRNDAFDFNCTLSDFKTTWVDRQAPQESKSTAPAKDLSLKEGQKIKINFKGLGRGEDGEKKKAPAVQASSGVGFGIIAPPPAAGGMSRRHAAAAAPVVAAADHFGNDFGDFQSIPAAQAAPTAAPASHCGGYSAGPVAAQPAMAAAPREDFTAQFGGLSFGGSPTPAAQVPSAFMAPPLLAPAPAAMQQPAPSMSGGLDPFSFGGFNATPATTFCAGPAKQSKDPFDEFDIFK